jgi:hypothetical protein
MYGSSYMFRHYIAILRERSKCLLRGAQLRSSRRSIVDERVVSSDVVRNDVRLIFKGLNARRLYKSFGDKGLSCVQGCEEMHF